MAEKKDTTALELSKAFFQRMQDNAPAMYEALKELVKAYNVDTRLDYMQFLSKEWRNAVAVLSAIEGGK